MNHSSSHASATEPGSQSNGERGLLDMLDDDQRAGVLAGAGLTIISAGAGTGKTTTLTRRIISLIHRGMKPEQIVAMTFTRQAAMEMRERAETTGGESVIGVRFGTIHSVAAKILRRNQSVAAKILRRNHLAANLSSPRFLIIDDTERHGLIAEAIESLGMLNGFSDDDKAERNKVKSQLVQTIDGRIQSWKECGLMFEDSRSPTRPDLKEADMDAIRVWAELNKAMVDQGLVDFADLAPMATRILNGSEDAREWELGNIRAVLVDEWQDSNMAQIQLVRAMTSLGADLTVVGDDDQSLYGFRGSVPRLMEKTADYFPDIARRGLNNINLTTNRRCTEEILSPANMIVDHNSRAEPKVLRSGRNGEPVGLANYASDTMEANEIAKQISRMIADGAHPENIAVLMRSHFIANEINRALLKLNIPHVMQAGKSFIERSEVKDILAYVKLAVDPGSRFSFERIITKPTRGLGATATKKIIDHANHTGLPIHGSMAALVANHAFKKSATESAAEMARQLSYLSEAVEADEDAISIIEYILYDVGYLSWNKEQTEPSKTLQDSIITLRDIAIENPLVTDFLDVIMVAENSERKDIGGVHVGTIHGSKGLEWDHVFLPGFDEGVFPSEMATRGTGEIPESLDSEEAQWLGRLEGSLEEERRLAHVAMTRARHSVRISCAKMRKLFGRPSFFRPSRFFAEAAITVPKIKVEKKNAGAGNFYGGHDRHRGPARESANSYRWR